MADNLVAWHQHCDRTERRDAMVEREHRLLVAEFMAAAQTDPLRIISTPGFGDSVGGQKFMPMVDVLADQLGGVGCEPKWAELVLILSAIPAGQQWLLQRAEEHARFHELDAA